MDAVSIFVFAWTVKITTVSGGRLTNGSSRLLKISMASVSNLTNCY